MPFDDPDEVPDWVADYIGIPFRAKGRDRSGCDCWGLVRLVLSERLGLELPSYADGYDSLEDLGAIVELIGAAQAGDTWRRIAAEETRAGDIAVLRGVPTPHIGILVAPGVMLHTVRGAEASLARLPDQAWRHRLKPTDSEPYAGYYRSQRTEDSGQRSDNHVSSALLPLPKRSLGSAQAGCPPSFDQGQSGDVFAPGEGEVEVVVCPHPFRVERRRVRVPAGLSLEEIFVREQPDPLLRLHGAAWIGEQRISPRAAWRRVRPKPGARVTVRALPPVPRGGDSKVLRTALMIAVIAAAIAAPHILPGLVPGTLTAGLVSAGIAVGGSLLINALLPVQARRLERRSSSSESPTFSIEGAQNVLRPYEPIPRPLGTHRFVGHLGARTYRQVINGDVYFRILLIWGTGPLQVTDLQIGETPIEAFDDVRIETRQGFPDDEPLTLFTNDVVEEVPGVTLTNATGFVTRRTQEDTEEIDLDFTFPQGLVWLQEDGDRHGLQVRLMIQYAEAGTENWTADDLGKVTGSGALDLGPTPTGVIKYHPGDSRWEVTSEPRSRTDAIVVDRYTGEIGVFKGPESYRFKSRNDPDKSEWRWRICRPIPKPPHSKVVLAWVKRIYQGEPGGIPANRIIDRRSAPTFEETGLVAHQGTQIRPARVAFNTSDVLVGSSRIKQPRADYAFRNEEFVSLGSSGNLPGGLPAGQTVYVVNRTSASYQLALTPGGDPITITDAGAGTHFISDILGAPEADFAVTTAAPAANTVNHTGGKAAFQGLLIEGNTTSALRVGLNFPVPKNQYDVRVRRITPDATEAGKIDEVVWTGLRSVAYQDPWNLPGVARTALQIRATEQLEGRVEPISALLTSLGKVWESGEQRWVDDQPTNNPAALFRLVAQDRANKAARMDPQIDLPAIETWHEVCEAQGWAFNMVVDFRTTVPEMLSMIAAAGMASVSLPDGKLSVVQDIDKTVPVQHISPRNSFGYQGQLSYPQVPHGWRVRFIDETSGYKNNERIVYDDGYTEANARKLLGIEFPGVTDPELIWRHARRRIAEARLRPETHKVSLDIEGLVATRGDLVRFSHDAVKVGLGHGRLKDVALSGVGEALGVTLDEAVPMELGTSYVIRVRDETGTSVLAPVDTVAGAQRNLTFTTPITNPTIQAGDHFLFGELGQESKELIVTGIQPDQDLGFTLTMVDLARDIFKADDLAVAFSASDVDAGADTFGPSGHGFVDGDRVVLTTTGALPAADPSGLEAARVYQVVGADSDGYQLSEDLESDPAAAAPLDLVDGGTGTHTAIRQIPPFDARISQDPILPEQAKPVAPVIEDIRSDESVMIRAPDGGLEARIAIRFSIPATTTQPDAIEAQIRGSEGGQPWRRGIAAPLPADELLIGDVEQFGVYDLRLRSITPAGVASDWTARLAYEVEGGRAPPPDVSALLVDGDRVQWELADAPGDVAGFTLRWHQGIDQTWATAEPVFANLITGNEASIAALAGGTKTLLVKTVDKFGNESVNAKSVVIDLPFALADRELDRIDLKTAGFPGTITGGTVLGSGPATTRDLVSGNHGTLIGGPTWVKGLTGNSALLFDGADRSVSMGDVHDFPGHAPFTIECRFRARIPTNIGAGQHYVLVGKRQPGGAANGYVLWVSATTGAIRAIRHGSGTKSNLVGPVLEDQREYFVALVYDGSDLRLDLDAVTVAGPIPSPQPYLDHSGDFRIGKDSNVGGFRFRGTIDEVRVWNVARTPAQQAADKDRPFAGAALAVAIADGLAGYWPFQEGTIDGDLVGLPTELGWIPGGDELPGWAGDDFDPGWPRIYDEVIYRADFRPALGQLPGNMLRAIEPTGRAVRFRAAIDGQPGWPEALDSAPGWQVRRGPGGAVIGLDDVPTWQPEAKPILWPGRVEGLERQSYGLETRILAGEQQPRISRAELILEGQLREEKVNDLAVAAGGTRIPLTERYRKLTEVLITLQDDGGAAAAIKVADREPSLGPLVIARDAAGAQTTAIIDAIVRGLL